MRRMMAYLEHDKDAMTFLYFIYYYLFNIIVLKLNMDQRVIPELECVL